MGRISEAINFAKGRLMQSYERNALLTKNSDENLMMFRKLYYKKNNH